VPAGSFVLGPYTPDLEPGELVVGLRFPERRRTASVFIEHARRHGDFALLSVAATGTLGGDGVWRHVRLVLGGVADGPLAPPEAAAALEGTTLDAEAVEAAAAACVAAADPPSDVRASAEYRAHLIPFYVERALAELRGQA
jgi:carbon-monoxide dehydrogenase medium subunit